jgi:hypothetical protein
LRTMILAGAATLAALVPAPGAAADFTPQVTNPYFPARPGLRWVYRGHEEGRRLRNVVRVLDRVEIVDGVPCAVIRDRVFLNGHLEESTLDWYTQDDRGRVWYYGEDTRTFDRHGHLESREGSWRAGVDGARPGIYMPAHPRVGRVFAQEHYPGHAEDHFRVLSRHATIHTPYRTFRRRALKTGEWTPLEPGVRDRKWFVRGIGQVAEATVRGGSDRAKLVSFHSRDALSR